MSPEEKKLLEETFEFAKENNKMLRQIRRAQKWASFLRAVYWLVIIGLGIGTFYFLEPYIDQAKSFIANPAEGVKNIMPR